jgi:VanZ family protein
MSFFFHRRRVPAYLSIIIALGLSTLPADIVGVIMEAIFGPAKDQAAGLIPIDKAIHVGVYTCVGFTFAAAVSNNKWNDTPLKYALIAIVLSSLFGVFDECYQFVSDRGRQFDLLDIVADIIGVFIGVYCYHWKGSGLKNWVSSYFATNSI